MCKTIEPLLNDLNNDIASEWVKSWQTLPLTASTSSPVIKKITSQLGLEAIQMLDRISLVVKVLNLNNDFSNNHNDKSFFFT